MIYLRTVGVTSVLAHCTVIHSEYAGWLRPVLLFTAHSKDRLDNCFCY